VKDERDVNVYRQENYLCNLVVLLSQIAADSFWIFTFREMAQLGSTRNTEGKRVCSDVGKTLFWLGCEKNCIKLARRWRHVRTVNERGRLFICMSWFATHRYPSSKLIISSSPVKKRKPLTFCGLPCVTLVLFGPHRIRTCCHEENSSAELLPHCRQRAGVTLRADCLHEDFRLSALLLFPPLCCRFSQQLKSVCLQVI